MLAAKINVVKKFLLLFLCWFFLAYGLQAQLSVVKMLGKNADQHRLGYALFSYADIPLNEVESQSVRLELLDLAYFPGRDGDGFVHGGNRAFLSIKLGYKRIFSETKTGFYLVPAVGYCRVVYTPDDGESTFGDGVAAALEGGYSLEVGQRGQTINLGLKYEADRASRDHALSSLALRLAYSFQLFRRREEW